LSPEPPDSRIEAFLEERLPGSETAPLAGDASTRRYFRVLRPKIPAVLALYPEPFDPRESPFLEIHALLVRWGLPVPKLLDTDGKRGILLLEDLGDQTLQEILRSAPEAEREALYLRALVQLANLQRASQEGPRTASCFGLAFDTEKLSWELHYFVKHFLEGLRGRDLSVSDRASLQESFHALASEIACFPRVLCHRDFHSRNLMLHRGILFWIDFQDARLGPATYDLVSLLGDSYVDLPEALIEDLAGRFRRDTLPREDRATFGRRFGLVSVQRKLKALGTFGFMAKARGNAVYLPYIPGTLASVRRDLSRFGELDGLRRVLADHIEELQ
jgi:aminoglycoside/choline kinase family phosphotransferase